ncbi:MAG: hypothetical protein HDR43_01785 [Mycoplasma sp.]|nr:hypothetical protein [Mycoplasma sp.]
MHLSKKSKLILAWAAPSVALIVAAEIAIPIVVVSKQNESKTLNNSKNIKPQSFASFDENKLSQLPFNPKDYDFDFFYWNIVQSPDLVNTVFNFEGTTYDSITRTWVNANNVRYSIIDVTDITSSDSENYVLNLTISKKNGNLEIKYPTVIEISSLSFVDSNTSINNFVSRSAEEINSSFLNGDMKIISNKPEASSINDFNSSSDVDVVTNLGSSTFIKDINNSKYITNDSKFQYSANTNSFVEFSIPVSQNIFSASDYILEANGEISESSNIYSKLKSEYDSNNLLYLPELDAKELNDIKSSKVSKAEIDEATLKKRIQKLIFDPSKSPYNFDSNGNKVPLSTSQALLVKIELGSSYTWIVVWTDLLTISSSLIDNAPELEMKAVMKDNKELKWSDLVEKKNYRYFETIQRPSNNLIYTVIDVKFDDQDASKTAATVSVRISHKDLDTTKEYTTIVTKGFESKAYGDLADKVKELTSDYTDMSKVAPTITKKDNVENSQIINNLSNNNWLMNNLNFDKPNNMIVDVVYTIQWAFVDGNTVHFSFLLSPIADPTNYIKYNFVEQSVFATLELNDNTTNKLVFLNS